MKRSFWIDLAGTILVVNSIITLIVIGFSYVKKSQDTTIDFIEIDEQIDKGTEGALMMLDMEVNRRNKAVMLKHYFIARIYEKKYGKLDDKAEEKMVDDMLKDLQDRNLTEDKAIEQLKKVYEEYKKLVEQKADIVPNIEILFSKIFKYLEGKWWHQRLILVAGLFVFMLVGFAIYADYADYMYMKDLRVDFNLKMLKAAGLAKMWGVEVNERNLKIIATKIFERELKEMNGEQIDDADLMADALELICNEPITDNEASGMLLSVWLVYVQRRDNKKLVKSKR
ncbi:MAG: hypothetical protein KatS3mg083_610 [Candidatus Dojkabacteria bacterium]|nr:MAG: hypothetical protein KatS3mg083_610 [Candidatus Dojkabacteria bacterium]